jgi:hypothetical protein
MKLLELLRNSAGQPPCPLALALERSAGALRVELGLDLPSLLHEVVCMHTNEHLGRPPLGDSAGDQSALGGKRLDGRRLGLQ